MNINKQLLLAAGAFGIILGTSACNSSNNSGDIYARWQATEIENPLADSMYKEQENYIDTLSVLEEDMVSYFGTDDLKEIKNKLRAEIKSDKEMMEKTTNLLSLEFLKDNKVVFHSYPGSDTTNFKISDDKKTLHLINTDSDIEEVFTIDKINKSSLVLSQDNDGNKTIIKFRKFDNEKDKDLAENTFKELEAKLGSAMNPNQMDMDELDLDEETLRELQKQMENMELE